MITLLADPGRLAAPTLTVEGEAYRHLFRARRVAAGERLRVVDGEGRARFGEVAAVGRSAATVTLGEPAPDFEPAVRVDLLVTTLKPERAAWLVEKATEVGVFAIRFLHSARAPRTFGDGTVERLRRVAAAAVEQCGRARLPPVTGTHTWEEIEALTAETPERRVLDTAALEEPEPAAGAPSRAVALLVGPEGGWTAEERESFRGLGWRPLGLGARVLRTETAAVVGVARFVLSP
ncbi:MAG: rRNA (uracil1498-N3)-methyltransferase [Acidobacteriota bacterium]|jgi:16S rRNA (uracil1498-N3)-methyltransferase|nr:rRNA (uracil1498-N3)-methyltransferase [Acidobacteriota bacterium]